MPVFERAPIGAIRPIDVRVWVSGMRADGLSASRCRQACHLVGAILRTAVEDGRIAASPCVNIKLPRLPQIEMRYLSPRNSEPCCALSHPTTGCSWNCWLSAGSDSVRPQRCVAVGAI